jgi:hypothetical protein
MRLIVRLPEGRLRISLSDQGNYPPYQGIRISEPFWMISGVSKMPFLAYRGRKSLLSRFDYLAISQAKGLKTGLFCPLFCKPPVQFTVYKKSRRDHRHYKFSRKFHIRQVLTLPEDTPQFTVMRAPWSSTVEGASLD